MMNRRKIFGFLGAGGAAAVAGGVEPTPYRCDARGGTCGSTEYVLVDEPVVGMTVQPDTPYNYHGVSSAHLGIISITSKPVCARCGCEWRGPLRDENQGS